MSVSPEPNLTPLRDFDTPEVDISTLDTLELAAIETAPRKVIKKRISFIIRVSVTLLLFAFLFKSLSWSTLLVALAHVNLAIMLLGLIAGGFGLIVSSYQWQTLLHAERIHLPLLRLFNLYVVGIAFSHFLPTGMGGDVVKAFYVGRESGDGAASASAVVMSRITGFFGMLLLAFPALLIWHEHFNYEVILWFVLLNLGMVGMIGGAIFSSSLLPSLFKGSWTKHPVFASAIRIGNAISRSARRPRSLCIATLVGTLFWVVGCLNYYIYAAALGMNVPLYFYFVAIPIVSLITFLPISINGFGVRESAFAYIFSTIHVPLALSLLLIFLMDLQVLLEGVIGGCVYLTIDSREKIMKQQHRTSEQRFGSYRSASILKYINVSRFMMNNYNQLNTSTPQFNTDSPPTGEVTLRVRRIRPPMTSPASTPALMSRQEQGGPLTPMPPSLGPRGSVTPIPPSSDGEKASSVSAPAPTSQGTFNTPGSSGRKNRRFALIAAALCLFALLGAFGLYETTKATPNVTLYQVSSQNVTQYIGGGGIVFPRQRLDISYPAAERVTAVLVKAGDQVSSKQPLVQLDATQLHATIAQAADDLASTALYLNAVSATGNPVAIAQAQQAYNLAKDKYDALVAKNSSPLLYNDTLVSPMSGVVTSVNINPGQAFLANTPLLTIMDESTVIVHAKVPLSNLGQVRIGQSAFITPSALPNLNLPGTVSTIIPQANPQTDTFEVWIAVNNPDKSLLPGMSAFVRIQDTTKALVVPRLAVLNPDRESVVFVVRNEHAYLQHVRVVGRSISSLSIGAGLSANDKVVLVGQDTLQNGQQVHVTRVESQTS